MTSLSAASSYAFVVKVSSTAITAPLVSTVRVPRAEVPVLHYQGFAIECLHAPEGIAKTIRTTAVRSRIFIILRVIQDFLEQRISYRHQYYDLCDQPEARGIPDEDPACAHVGLPKRLAAYGVREISILRH